MGAAAPARTKSERQEGDVAEELGSQRGDPGGRWHLSGHSPPPQIRTPLLSPLLRSAGAVGRGKSSEGLPWAQHPGAGGFPAAPGGGPRTGPGRSPEPRFSRASASNLSPLLSFLPHWERGNGVNHVAATRGARAGGIPCSRSPRRAAGARPGSAECAACLGGGGARACNIGLGIITFNVKKI